ncbi:hypothetical protein LINPERPRIM_LOCUS1888 [Linum perenne]
MKVLCFRELCDRNRTVKIQHAYREGNHAADFLAKNDYDYPFGSYTFLVSDSSLGYFLRYDCMGITEQRSNPN